MSTEGSGAARRHKGLPNWRFVRYADDFAVLIDGTRQDTEALREQIADVLATLGLRLSESNNLRGAPQRGIPVPGVPHPAAPQAGNGQVKRLHLHR